MNMIKFRNILEALGVAAIAAAMSGCAKEPEEINNLDNQRYFEAWMSINHPGTPKTGLGIYIIEDTPGTGREINTTDKYAFVHYTTRHLDGDIIKTTVEDVDKQLGKYSEGNWYGGDILHIDRNSSNVGMLEMLKGMKIGGTRTAVIPGWLNVANEYESEKDYIKNVSGSDIICTLTLTDAMEDIERWEISNLEAFVKDRMSGVDSTEFGYYYKRLALPVTEEDLPTDTTVCINYIGRLMNGRVFDTTIADTAKFYGIYSPTKEYKPVYIDFAEEYKDIKMRASNSSDASSTLVDGFSYCMSKMKDKESGIVAFRSDMGYGTKGQGKGIPKYAPISFEIAIVDDPED